ncbi:helix-turn-helix transcriptional regulator [Aurantimonas sp. 22II-16-19i]|uniref:helix-turn-helix domain-containing protein n=1 Tax=Aurantimonas sp. 22II-16-19i TaxID=1317114 RepID=UPI0009F7EE76|nr:helix-turn-helix transcriptional regulator [Aurantimonas sp. 22II-16-19i]ORE93989.1 XRE family transcriptional regulator [Aurantimonas sp. 22II-16-19i]
MPAFSEHSIDEAVGERLRELRLAAGLSQADVARFLHATVRQIDLYERGKARIGPGRLSELSERFGVSVLSFFDKVGASLQTGDADAHQTGSDDCPGSRDERVRALVRSVLQQASARLRH